VTEKGKSGLLAGIAAAVVVAGIVGTVAFYKVPAFHRLLHPHPGDNAATPKAGESYTCPMHPFIHSDRPGTCPICGMNLVPEASEAKGAAAENAARLGMVSMNPTQRLMANVATQKVARRDFGAGTVAVGKVSWDERRLTKIAARTGGRVEKLHVDFTGTPVREGQPLLEIYSPDLVASQREYLVALAGVEKFRDSPYGDAREMAEKLLAASRTRLSLWGVTDAQIAELSRAREPRTVFTVFSPVSGVVTERLVTAGQYVMDGGTLYSVAQADPVWVEAEVYENDFGAVPAGAAATVTTDAYPGRRFFGKVSFVDPFLNPETRTAKVRVELANPGGLLKPDMFVRVELRSGRGKALAVPESAVLVTGQRAMAWVEVSQNAFEPRVVRLGRRSGGYYQVLSGLSEGDTVVTSAGFLIDSESQLRSGSSDPHAGHGK
jgi:Cu(I)/Ag(I) efflux system membrane fusion protein